MRRTLIHTLVALAITAANHGAAAGVDAPLHRAPALSR